MDEALGGGEHGWQSLQDALLTLPIRGAIG